MDDVFKKHDPAKARRSLREVDESPDTKLLWIEENLPLAYRDHLDLYRGMKVVARADDFLSRVHRRQHYGFWSYTSDLLGYGVCAVKQKELHGYIKYNFPMYLVRMSRSKGNRALQGGIASKLGAYTHMSSKGARQDFLPTFKLLFQRNEAFRLKMVTDLELEEEEIAFLLGDKVDGAAVKRVLAEAKGAEERKSAPAAKAVVDKPAKPEPPRPAPNHEQAFLRYHDH